MNWLNRRAILYKRISDEDQSSYSLDDQQDRLENFCKLMGIQVVKTFTDDGYSAKSFDRPQFKEFLKFAAANKKAADLFLFTNWSRFSRAEQMGETHMMISKIQKLGLNIQAIEQPLDLTIPESLLILSFYIASPAVENLRRASNIKNGIHRAKKEGRSINKAPFGYRNARDERNKPILEIVPEQAKLVARIFTEYLTGDIPGEILNRARRISGKELKGNSMFYKIISNPLYAGLMRVPKFKDEPEHLVQGKQEAIISQDIWYAANHKYKFDNSPQPKILNPDMPLRGVIACGNCHRQMTGGRSKGKGGGYFLYYRCHNCNGYNFSVKKAHSELGAILQGLSLNQEQIDFYISEVEKETKAIINENAAESGKLDKELKSLESQLHNLESKFIANQVDFETYQKHFPILRGLIAEKRLRLEVIQESKDDVLQMFRDALPKMMDMNKLYEDCGFEDKQMLLRLLFPGGIYKQKESYRTPYVFDMFDTEAATGAGLVIGENIKEGVFYTDLPERGGKRPEIEHSGIIPLLQFIQKLAA